MIILKLSFNDLLLEKDIFLVFICTFSSRPLYIEIQKRSNLHLKMINFELR